MWFFAAAKLYLMAFDVSLSLTFYFAKSNQRICYVSYYLFGHVCSPARLQFNLQFDKNQTENCLSFNLFQF